MIWPLPQCIRILFAWIVTSTLGQNVSVGFIVVVVVVVELLLVLITVVDVVVVFRFGSQVFNPLHWLDDSHLTVKYGFSPPVL